MYSKYFWADEDIFFFDLRAFHLRLCGPRKLLLFLHISFSFVLFHRIFSDVLLLTKLFSRPAWLSVGPKTEAKAEEPRKREHGIWQRSKVEGRGEGRKLSGLAGNRTLSGN